MKAELKAELNREGLLSDHEAQNEPLTDIEIIVKAIIRLVRLIKGKERE